MAEFEYQEVIYDWDEYTLGDIVECISDQEGPEVWSKGTLVRIDYDDPSLPWGVSARVLEPHEYEFDGEDLNTDEGWDWIRPDSIRRPDYVIEEEEEAPMAVSW